MDRLDQRRSKDDGGDNALVQLATSPRGAELGRGLGLSVGALVNQKTGVAGPAAPRAEVAPTNDEAAAARGYLWIAYPATTRSGSHLLGAVRPPR